MREVKRYRKYTKFGAGAGSAGFVCANDAHSAIVSRMVTLRKAESRAPMLVREVIKLF